MRSILLPALLLLAVAAPARAGGPRVVVSGNVTVSEEDLLEAAESELRVFRRRPESAFAEDAAYEMQVLYLSLGYPLSMVEARLIEGGAAFLVREGPRVFLSETRIEGAPAFDHEALVGFVDLPKTGPLGFTGDRIFVASEMDSAAQQMISFLKQAGRPDASVAGPFVPDLDTLTEADIIALTGQEIFVHARYEIEQGPHARLASIEVEGENHLPESLLREVLDPRIGRAFSPFTPFDLIGVVVEMYAVRGYPFATVDAAERVEPTEEGIDVHMKLTIREGPKARFGRVEILGNIRTRDEVVRRELEFFPGDLFGARSLRRSRDWLMDTNLFAQVTIEPVRPAREVLESEEDVDAEIIVRVHEHDTLRLETSLGWGSWDLFRGSIGLTWLNLSGTGNSIGTVLDGSARGYGFTVTGKVPWTLPVILPRTDWDTQIRIEERERPNFSYNRFAVGTSLSKVWKQRKRRGYSFLGSFGYSLSGTDVFDVSGDVPTEFENTTRIGALQLKLAREARDSSFAPTKGSLLLGTLDLANGLLLSDIDFLRMRLSARRLFPLGEDFILVGRVSAGAIFPYGDTLAMPIQERFYLGGGESVRSFFQDDLGPRLIGDDGEPSSTAAGGEFFTLLNLELRTPISGSLQGAVFFDMGNIIRRVQDAGFTDYRYGIGAGLRYVTPLGPLRIDVGVNPNPLPFESRWQAIFAIGFPF